MPAAGNRGWVTTSGTSRLTKVSGFPLLQARVTKTSTAHHHQSIFATTKCQQNLEILKFALLWFDVFGWKKSFDLSVRDLFIYLTPVECFVRPYTRFTLSEMFHKHPAPVSCSCTPAKDPSDKHLLVTRQAGWVAD